MVRARLLELRERDFVLAARNMDAGTAHLVWRHGLPNTLDLLAVMAVNFVGCLLYTSDAADE